MKIYKGLSRTACALSCLVYTNSRYHSNTVSFTKLSLIPLSRCELSHVTLTLLYGPYINTPYIIVRFVHFCLPRVTAL